ncbi:MAG TPA: 4-hydroxy-tetrahydrodipicolinate synthase [Noviherbaspirillum sp.]|nr:4-hydroxy-tetrahydrodipicolinate synthase [Noviherbaspirillum sp.]
MTGFSGIWVPLATPFLHGELDIQSLQALARRLRASGVAGLVVCGSTGEAASLGDDEQMAALDAVIEAVPDCPVIMGLAGNNMRAVLTKLEQVQRRRIAGILAPAPYYIRPSQSGVAEYFETLANASSVPLVLYNIPYRTGVAMEFDTIARIALHERVTAIKDCGGDLGLTMRLIAETRLQVLAGEDAQLLSTLALGGSGCIAASAHVRADLFVRIFELMRAREIDEARVLFYHLLPMIRLIFREPNPGPLKAALAMMGWMTNALRMPMQTASAELEEHIRKELIRLECM